MSSRNAFHFQSGYTLPWQNRDAAEQQGNLYRLAVTQSNQSIPVCSETNVATSRRLPLPAAGLQVKQA
jgi:hypothetical protein